MTVSPTPATHGDVEPMNMHTDVQHGVTPLNMHTDVRVGAHGADVTITGRTAQGTRLQIVLPRQVAKLVMARVSQHVTSRRTPVATSRAVPAVYHFDATAQVTGDRSDGIVVTGPATSQGVTSNVRITFDPLATRDLGAQRADL